jgi:purine-binding chemotaxis protein CheW
MENLLMDSEQSTSCIEGGKHLVFKLNERDYGIPILLVNEIIGLLDITPVPKTPTFLKGVINLRGTIIPTIDLRLKLDMTAKEYDERTCIIIVSSADSPKALVGLLVDMVSEVFDIPTSDIEPPLRTDLVGDVDFLKGIGKIKDKVIMLLNISSIINFEEIFKYVSK